MEGTDGVSIISDLTPSRNGNSISIPGGSGQFGATTALTWIWLPDVVHEILAYGTQAGYLVVWKEIRGEKNVRFF